MTKLHFSYPQIVVSEVPGEISLALSISGCPLRCKNCHSQETYDPLFGRELNTTVLNKLIGKHITTVLFYGGEWNEDELIVLLQFVHSKNLKTCLYTGLNYEKVSQNIIDNLDFIKVGPYIEELGPVFTEKTNQKFIVLNK